MDGFRELGAYRKAVTLADEIRRSVLAWESLDRWTLGVQLMRAADSIGANLAEAREVSRMLNGLIRSWRQQS